MFDDELPLPNVGVASGDNDGVRVDDLYSGGLVDSSFSTSNWKSLSSVKEDNSSFSGESLGVIGSLGVSDGFVDSSGVLDSFGGSSKVSSVGSDSDDVSVFVGDLESMNVNSSGVYKGVRDFGVNDNIGGGSSSRRLGFSEFAFFDRVANVGYDSSVRDRLRLADELMFGCDSYGSSYGVLSDKDFRVLYFISLFRAVRTRTLGRVIGVRTYDAVLKRLRRLESFGFIRSDNVVGFGLFWFLTFDGVRFVDNGASLVKDADRIRGEALHLSIVSYIASCLWSGSLNVLDLPDFPGENRVDVVSGERVLGESLVCEAFIKAGVSRLIMNGAKGEARNILSGFREDLLGPFYASGCRGVAPELEEGNEALFSVLTPLNFDTYYHNPDLVVVRERGVSGAPESIAVEVELLKKPLENYERTIACYMNDSTIFGRVVWVCKNKRIANAVMRAVESFGVEAKRKIKVMLLLTEKGYQSERLYNVS